MLCFRLVINITKEGRNVLIQLIHRLGKSKGKLEIAQGLDKCAYMEVCICIMQHSIHHVIVISWRTCTQLWRFAFHEVSQPAELGLLKKRGSKRGSVRTARDDR